MSQKVSTRFLRAARMKTRLAFRSTSSSHKPFALEFPLEALFQYSSAKGFIRSFLVPLQLCSINQPRALRPTIPPTETLPRLVESHKDHTQKTHSRDPGRINHHSKKRRVRRWGDHAYAAAPACIVNLEWMPLPSLEKKHQKKYKSLKMHASNYHHPPSRPTTPASLQFTSLSESSSCYKCLRRKLPQSCVSRKVSSSLTRPQTLPVRVVTPARPHRRRGSQRSNVRAPLSPNYYLSGTQRCTCSTAWILLDAGYDVTIVAEQWAPATPRIVSQIGK